MKVTMKFKQVAMIGLLTAALSMPALAQDRAKKEIKLEAEAVKLAREVVRGGYNVITVKEFKELLDSGKSILVVDTMPYADSYQKEHVPGAKQFLFPIPEMETWDTKETDGKTKEDFETLLGADKKKTIVFYCGFVKCTRSHNAAAWAVKLGYQNVYRFPGGIVAWKGCKYPVESAK